MGIETIVILSTFVVVSNTIVLGINTKVVNECMKVMDGNAKIY